jgi:two-component system, LytTR family, sensor kinase
VNKLPYKQLIKTAFITAPLIAVTYCTPLFIFNAIPNFGFFTMLPLFTIPILIAWFLNILFLAKVKAAWVSTFIRTLVISVIMFGFSGIVLAIVDPFVKIDSSYVTLVRVVNIVSVNSIVFVLIDLTLTKENKNQVELENANLKIATLEAEYKSLKDQVNPHFLFNALSTAKALIKPNPELAEQYIVRLSDFLRAGINHNKKTNPLGEEIQLCEGFIALNQIRFGKALHFEYHLPLDLNRNHVPYFALLSLLENAIKHNTFTLESPLHIVVSLQDGMIGVRNNRKQKFVIEASSGTGIKNLNERYKLISGKEITITETEHDFSVQIPILES